MLAGKSILVTGASRGVGAGISCMMAKAGAGMVVNDVDENDANFGRSDGIEAVVADTDAMGRRAETAGQLVDGGMFVILQ